MSIMSNGTTSTPIMGSYQFVFIIFPNAQYVLNLQTTSLKECLYIFYYVKRVLSLFFCFVVGNVQSPALCPCIFGYDAKVLILVYARDCFFDDTVLDGYITALILCHSYLLCEQKNLPHYLGIVYILGNILRLFSCTLNLRENQHCFR